MEEEQIPIVEWKPKAYACLDKAEEVFSLVTGKGLKKVAIPKECKRLAEVDFPIAVVSKHSAREKSIRHGHPSTLHLWWARRPLGACRAMLLALLLPDPCDKHCPLEFKKKARELLKKLSSHSYPQDIDLRRGLLKFIGDFSNWDLSTDLTWLEVGRGLVKAAHPEETPLVVDPFAGGGSIPLEALRLGCEAFASDLNPVACLILKVMLEDIPRHGQELAEELRRVGAEIKQKAEKELAVFYPKDPDGATPIAYLWARTVWCESPTCGAEIPLMRSFWLRKKANRKRALRVMEIGESRPSGFGELPYGVGGFGTGVYPEPLFEIFEPKNEKEVPNGTVTRAKATCLCCNAVLSPERVRAQLAGRKGGADVIFDDEGHRIGGARMLAVVTLKPGEQGRHYRLPNNDDYHAVWKAQKQLGKILEEWEQGGKQGLCPVPDEPMNPIRPSPNARGLSAVTRYGMCSFGDLFTLRQKVALVSLVRRVNKHKKLITRECSDLLAIAVGRVADATANLTRWLASGEEVKNVFSRQALPIVWDFGETNPISTVSRSWMSALEAIRNVLMVLGSTHMPVGQVQQADAVQHPLPNLTAKIWFSDPPYYDAIPYADLSDFFFVWLKRAIPQHSLLRDPFDVENELTPKLRECVWNRAYPYKGRPKDKLFFEETITRAFAQGKRILREDGVGSVVFAHQTTEGWEAFLSGLVAAGWTVTASWPIVTEMASRIRARENASLATSVHLICRSRPENAAVGDWGDVLKELPKRVRAWLDRLEGEGIQGADLIFSCIGPALEIFSRYSKVETAEGEEIPLSQFLEKVWEVIGKEALKEILGTDAPNQYGEDARLTALFLWTLRANQTPNGQGNGNNHEEVISGDDDESLESDEDEEKNKKKKGGYALPYDIVRRFCQPLGIHIERWEGKLIEIEKGVVRLIPIKERSEQFLDKETVRNLSLAGTSRKKKSNQMNLFENQDNEKEKENIKKAAQKMLEKETWSHLHLNTISLLDHVHKAMLFQKQGQTNALRELLFYEKSNRPDFLRLANALSALYPDGTEEKRLLDAMLLSVPR